MKNINFALVEEERPPIYTAMKYWGKKPHNIWREYIKNYTPEDGLYLDPFAGSAISAFEAVKAGRKAIAFDLNPLTAFLIETFCGVFDREKFVGEFDKIVDEIENDNIYQSNFYTTCRKCGNVSATVQNFKWEDGALYEVGVECLECNPGRTSRYLEKPSELETKKGNEIGKIKIDTWCPEDEFHNSPSFSASFIQNIGGRRFSDLWTKRNLYIISKIFNHIIKVDNIDIRNQLLLGFIKTIHLCTKMCVPRRGKANRPFSTSWGRSAYLCSSRQMEMNPLMVFYGSCFGKQSVESSLGAIESYIGKIPKILYVDKSNKGNRSQNYDIKYGIIDINTMTDYISESSVDFIMTDPPYGGLVQYLDLSAIWLVWLKKVDQRFTPDYENEITVKGNIQNLNAYKIRFQNGIQNLFKVLKDDGKVVFTFHNKDIKIWNAFLNSISLSGFKIEKVIHQQNRRTGESNVANPYGTSASDFYIRCVKKPATSLKTDEEVFEHYVVSTTINLIAQRNEPTPYQILFNGLLAEISSAGFDTGNFDTNIEQILSKHLGTIFKIKDNNSKAGKHWWFANPEVYIKYPDKKLTERLEETVSSFLRRKVSVTLDEVLGEIFVRYPNGLTPDVVSVSRVLQKYANKSGGQGGKWIYKGGETEKDFTDHTEMLFFLAEIGRKMRYEVYIGKREQAETYNGEKLSKRADITNLNRLNFDREKKDRVAMIDMIWIKNNIVAYALEVENSTNFMSGIQRASNLDRDIKKIMVLPNKRKDEFLRIKDPLFIESFKMHNWGFMFYDDIFRLKSLRIISEENIKAFCRHLEL